MVEEMTDLYSGAVERSLKSLVAWRELWLSIQ